MRLRNYQSLIPLTQKVLTGACCPLQSCRKPHCCYQLLSKQSKKISKTLDMQAAGYKILVLGFSGSPNLHVSRLQRGVRTRRVRPPSHIANKRSPRTLPPVCEKTNRDHKGGLDRHLIDWDREALAAFGTVQW